MKIRYSTKLNFEGKTFKLTKKYLLLWLMVELVVDVVVEVEAEQYNQTEGSMNSK